MKIIGVDVGGTFTDLVLCDMRSGKVAIHKIATTPEDPSLAVMKGIREICVSNEIPPQDIDYVFHGTTTATNAVLENKGARTGMITNQGFRDIIHIGRHQRVQHYSIMQELPWQNRALIARRFRKTVAGRLTPPSGEELIPLDKDGVRKAALELKNDGVEAVAICFLFSYLNSAHEVQAKAIVEEIMPEAFVTTSSFISPQFREFERFTTASLAAFIGPKVKLYIHRIDAALRETGINAELRIMASNGGVATPEMVTEKPSLTLLSGLAAGVLGGAMVGKQLKRNRLITFDIGGTSADIGIVVDGKLAETDARSTSIAGFPLVMPMIDIHTIGAGGGSVAHVDHAGGFKVGPQSAGAVPGPACYGKGGIEPTVTDAHVVLGRLDPDDFLGGSMRLDASASHDVIATLAAELHMSVNETAEGILKVINSNMANAIYSRTVQKGIDPRDFTLVALGGAGPLHGAEVASLMGIPEIAVPLFPGITSAMGLLTTDLKYDEVRTQFQLSSSPELVRLNADFKDMEAQMSAQFKIDKVSKDNMSFARVGDLRYVGQGYELKISFPVGRITHAALAKVWSAFHRAHAAEYGHAFKDSPIELVNICVSGRGKIPKLNKFKFPAGSKLKKALIDKKSCLFRVRDQLQSFDTPFYRRELLPLEKKIKGPAIILQTDSTTVIPPQSHAMVAATGSILIKI